MASRCELTTHIQHVHTCIHCMHACMARHRWTRGMAPTSTWRLPCAAGTRGAMCCATCRVHGRCASISSGSYVPSTASYQVTHWALSHSTLCWAHTRHCAVGSHSILCWALSHNGCLRTRARGPRLFACTPCTSMLSRTLGGCMLLTCNSQVRSSLKSRLRRRQRTFSPSGGPTQ